MEFTETLLVRAPVDVVRATCLDLDAAARWMPGLVRIERMDQGPLRVGSQWRQTRRIMGMEASELFELRALDDRAWSLHVDGRQGSTGRGEYQFDYSLAPQGEQTLLALRARIEMGDGWLPALLTRLLGGSFKKAIRKDQVALKAYIEART